MKTLLAIAAATATLFAFGTPDAQAGDRCRVHSTCHQCHQPVYSYYRPVRYISHTPVYGWVPALHSGCRSQSHGAVSSGVTVRVYTGPRTTGYHNYGYRSVPSHRSVYSTRSLRDYHVHRSFPTTRYRSFSTCR